MGVHQLSFNPSGNHAFDYHALERPEKDLKIAAAFITCIEDSDVAHDVKTIMTRIGSKVYLHIQKECQARKGESRRNNISRV